MIAKLQKGDVMENQGRRYVMVGRWNAAVVLASANPVSESVLIYTDEEIDELHQAGARFLRPTKLQAAVIGEEGIEPAEIDWERIVSRSGQF